MNISGDFHKTLALKENELAPYEPVCNYVSLQVIKIASKRI